jgi:WD40 repeat protein
MECGVAARPTRSATALHIAAVFVAFVLVGAAAQAAGLGIFEGQADVGLVAHTGSVEFNPERKLYLLSGGGENMWAGTDAFHFVWIRLSGDLKFAADIEWPQAGGNAHRKACLLIRQNLEPGAAYADAALHGEGLCSLQYREAADGPTREIQSNVSKPRRIQIEKQGDVVAMSVAPPGEELAPAGGSFKLHFQEPFYVGLGVCSHDNRVVETAAFSNVQLVSGSSPLPTNAVVESTLEIVTISSKDRRAIYHTRGVIEAPNWSHDSAYFIFNSKGHIFRLARSGGQPEMLDSGLANHCNNDHGFSPDGTQLAISHHAQGGRSLVYLIPVSGGTPQQVTKVGPSYWHGWSPDGKTLAYCGERNGNFDVFTIPVGGGEETRLTTASGLDDGPEYSPDGRYIYFNSDRTGAMKIWRMKPDGSEQEQVTTDGSNDWFPHLSPDGKWLVFLTYASDVQGHPANKDVLLRLRPVAGGEVQVLAKLFGGQGTMNVPSWSPDSKQLAFVSYRLVAP